MKKLAVTAIITLAAAGLFTACGGSQNNGQDIGRDAALEAALNDAGVAESDTTRLQVSEDRDDGKKTYEIRFDASGKEYEYEILASDGKIMSSDVENIDNGTGTVQDQQAAGQNSDTQNNAQENTQGNNASSGNTAAQNPQNANVAVSMEEATSTALGKVPGATQNDIRIELDFDDGKYKYEGDIIYQQQEYDFEIDANTGAVLSWSQERHD